MVMGIFSFAFASALAATSPTWGTVKYPAAGSVQIYGGYSAGCIRGASQINWDGAGYHVVRVVQNRYYGHPDLLRFIEEFGRASISADLGDFLVGDTSQPRGGPMRTGHKSHQIGIDADIWFRTLPGNTPALSRTTRDGLGTYSLVRADGKGIDDKTWKASHGEMLRHAALSPLTARIFVNPHIKVRMCQLYPESTSAEWLRRLRPWWGHDTHFHVRLNCPADQVACQSQEAIPEGSGCGEELASWFNPDGTVKPPTGSLDVDTMAALPSECQSVLAAPDSGK